VTLLARPYDFVAWRADELSRSPENDLCRVLRQILGRTQ
jgi:putative polyketide hydroxylase